MITTCALQYISIYLDKRFTKLFVVAVATSSSKVSEQTRSLPVRRAALNVNGVSGIFSSYVKTVQIRRFTYNLEDNLPLHLFSWCARLRPATLSFSSIICIGSFFKEIKFFFFSIIVDVTFATLNILLSFAVLGTIRRCRFFNLTKELNLHFTI